jgi:D-psicose/D-tagatose/L-ribulose 3-epimerase
MKIGINLLLWTDSPNAVEHIALFRKIKAWGFDGVEIPIDGLNRETAAALGAVLDELNLERTTISALDASQADPASRDALLRQAAVDALKRNIEHTKAVGAELMCGPLFQGLGRFTGRGPETDEWNYAVETIREAGEYAQTLGITIALEPLNRFEMYIVNTMADGARFVREVGLPNVGLLADTHHGNIEENDVADAWLHAGSHITHVHISENNRGVPGSGHAIGPNIFKTLEQIGYDSWVTIEAFGLIVPGLIPRLHLWRSYAEHNDDAAKLGLAFIQDQMKVRK